jgi:hypothetical protein
MADAQMVERANKVIERLIVLDAATANACAFCALLKDLNARDLSVEKQPHIDATLMVRAGILRAAIGTVIPCLDTKGSDRASVEQIIQLLKDKTLVGYFASARQGSTVALEQAREYYEILQKDGSLERGRQFRHEVVAHNLMLETNDLSPIVYNNALTPIGYDEIYKLADGAERIVIELYAACGQGKPSCLDWRGRTAKQARLFWDTYFSGMAAG